MDKERIRQLADSADEWVRDLHREWEQETDPTAKAGKLNYYFYWAGKSSSYHGILAGLEIQEMVEREVDATPGCP